MHGHLNKKILYIINMKQEISFDDYSKVEIKVGTVLSVKKNEKARKPSLVVEVDFGEKIGVKKSSAQITHYYNEQNLIGKQVIGVCNFPKKNIAGIVSEVLILGAIEKDGKVVLVQPSQKVENGLEIA
jgi:tRNA-binding protein